jgi:hypothetical protein
VRWPAWSRRAAAARCPSSRWTGCRRSSPRRRATEPAVPQRRRRHLAALAGGPARAHAVLALTATSSSAPCAADLQVSQDQRQRVPVRRRRRPARARQPQGPPARAVCRAEGRWELWDSGCCTTDRTQRRQSAETAWRITSTPAAARRRQQR